MIQDATQTEASQDQIEFLTLTDLSVGLFPLNQKNAVSNRVQSGHQKLETWETPKTTLSVFYHNADCCKPTTLCSHITQLTLYFSQNKYPLFAEIEKQPWYQLSDLSQQTGLHTVYIYETTLTDDNRIDLLTLIFNSFLVLGRPLRDFRCSFFIPLDPFSNDDIKKDNYKANHFAIGDDKARQYLPTQLQAEAKLTYGGLKEASEAYLYFKPHLRDFLFYQDQKHSDLHPIKEYYLDTKSRYSSNQNIYLSLSLKKAALTEEVVKDRHENEIDLDAHTEDELITGKVEKVCLHQFYNQLSLLQVYVQGNAFRTNKSYSWEKKENPLWWQDILLGNYNQAFDVQRVETNRWLKYAKLVRQLYPVFIKQENEGKIGRVFLWTEDKKTISKPSKTGLDLHEVLSKSHNEYSVKQFAPWVTDLVTDYLKTEATETEDETNMRCNQVLELLSRTESDRAFVSSSYCFAGIKPSTPTEQWNQDHLLSLMLFVDDDTMASDDMQGFAASPDFIRPLLHDCTYKRWQDLGTQYSFTDYACTAIGYGDYFKNNISNTHIPQLYERMLTVALFYRQSLSHYERRISEIALLANRKDQAYRKHMTRLKKEMILFTNHYWFSELSNQTQGQEIYQHQLDSLKLKEQYHEIKEQLHWTQDFTLNANIENLTQKAVFFAIFSIFIAAIALGLDLLTTYCPDSFKSDTKSQPIEIDVKISTLS